MSEQTWDEHGTFETANPTGLLGDAELAAERGEKLFVLDTFPYRSGSGLHVGHPLGLIGTDVYARFKRMTGHNVFHTMGFDAFGLPAEQYAVETGQHPRITTDQNVATYRRQLRRLSLAHDPRRGISTTDPEYYRRTQWIFSHIFDAWYVTSSSPGSSRWRSARSTGHRLPDTNSISCGPPGARRSTPVRGPRPTSDAPYVNSSNATLDLNGIERTAEGIATNNAWLEANDAGEATVTSKRRDWPFSRQRYWGEPFPIVYDADGNPHARSSTQPSSSTGAASSTRCCTCCTRASGTRCCTTRVTCRRRSRTHVCSTRATSSPPPTRTTERSTSTHRDARQAYEHWQPDEPSPILAHDMEMIRQAREAAKRRS